MNEPTQPAKPDLQNVAGSGQEFPATISHGSTGPTLGAGSPNTAWELPGGRYQVMGEIARGGMGVVLRAIDVDLQRPLAIKVMLSPSSQGGAGGVPCGEFTDREGRFLEEARITGQLQHPGIPPVHEIGRLADGRPFFAMKLIEGRTLAELLSARATGSASATQGSASATQGDLPRFLKVFEQIAQTLAYAHSQGVIHRDLKPSNVMVGAFGEVQVMDWGLARRCRVGPARAASAGPPTADVGGPDIGGPAAAEAALSHPTDSADRLTQHGQVLGTPAYMPPEQARGEIEALDERADVFGLGAILCVILTGAPPYVGRDRPEIVRRAQQAELADAFQRLAACGADAELIALANACLAPLPDARPRDAGVVAAKLTAYLESVEARLRQAELERAQAQLKAQEERKRRRLTMAWSLTTAVAITVVTGGWLWFQNKLEVQETERRQTVLAALEKVDDLTAQTRWKEAELVLDQADQRLGDGGPADLRQRLEQARRETRFLADLDEARMARSRATAGQSKFLDGGASAAAYERAFAAFDLEVLQAEPQQIAERLLTLRPEVRSVAVLALDDWVYCVDDAQLKERLRRVAGDVDDDPWRRRFRQARDLKALETLEQEALTAELPIVSLVLLGAASKDQRAEEAAVRVLRRAVRLYAADFWAHFILEQLLRARTSGRAKAVEDTAAVEERVGHLRAAVAARPQAAPAHNNLGHALYDKRDMDGAIAAYLKAIELEPKFALPHNNLGNALRAKGDVEAAIAAYRKAIELEPKDAIAHNSLGNALRDKGKVDGAIAAYRKAIELDPKDAKAHTNLGTALRDKGDVQRAIAAYRKAIELDPELAMAHYNLGNALRAKGDVEGAIAAYRKAIELDPKDALAHYNLGFALHNKGDVEGAIAAYRKAIELNPKDALAHVNLGFDLRAKGDVEAAIAAFRKAIELDPKDALAHYNLGNALRAKGDVEAAIAAFRKAIELDPKYAEAHCNLGLLLSSQGHFADALVALQRGHELGSQQPGWSYPSAQWVRETQRLVELDAKLPALLKGDLQPPSIGERLEYVQLCQTKKLHAGAARLYADAFSADPKLAEDLDAEHRYNAACSAALAGCGQGKDAAKLDEKERAAWRKQTLDWLRADLKAWTALFEHNPQTKDAVAKTIAKTMAHWQTDPDLAGVRDQAALKKLPPHEQPAWQQFWADAAALRKRAEQPADVKLPK